MKNHERRLVKRNVLFKTVSDTSKVVLSFPYGNFNTFRVFTAANFARRRFSLSVNPAKK